MNVILIDRRTGEETIVTDAAAFVADSNGHYRICRDGKPDEEVEALTTVVVTP